MTRRLLVAGVVVAVVLPLTRRRFRRQLSAAVRLPVALAAAALVMPFHWWDDAWSSATGIVGQVKDWVLGLVGDVVNWLKGLIDWLSSRLDDLWRWVGDAFQAVYNFASSVVRDLVGWVEAGFGAIYRWASEAVSAVADFVGRMFHDLIRWASEALDAIGRFVEAVFDQLVRWVSEGLDAIGRFIESVWHDITRWVSDLVGTVWDWITGALRALWDNVLRPLWDFAFRWARTLLTVVEKAFDWLVMLAEHGPSWVIEHLAHAFEASPRLLLGALHNLLTHEGDAIEHWLADWLG